MLICYSSHGKLIDEESHTYSCCGIRCGDAGKVLVTEHGFTKSSINLSILLRPSSALGHLSSSSWPTSPLHFYKQASPTWIATSEKLSPVSWKISPSRKMGHCGSRVLWKMQVLFKSGKMFLLHMMESKQASLLKIERPSLSWEWTSVVPGTVRASNDPAFWDSHPCVFPAYTVQCWSVWPVIYDRNDGVSLLHFKNTVASLPEVTICLLALWLGSLALGSQPPCPKGTNWSRRVHMVKSTVLWWQSLEWAWKGFPASVKSGDSCSPHWQFDCILETRAEPPNEVIPRCHSEMTRNYVIKLKFVVFSF